MANSQRIIFLKLRRKRIGKYQECHCLPSPRDFKKHDNLQLVPYQSDDVNYLGTGSRNYPLIISRNMTYPSGDPINKGRNGDRG